MKTIWFGPTSLDEVKHFSKHQLMTSLGIELIEIGPDYLCASMPVDERTLQPLGSLHGGATCLLAETVGSVAANFCVDQTRQFCVGLEINANHIKAIKSGIIIAQSRPLHLGKSTQIWDIPIRDEQGNLIAISRLTMAVLNRK